MVLLHYTLHYALQDFISRIILIRYELDPSRPRTIYPFPPQPEQTLYFFPYDQVKCHDHLHHRMAALCPHTIVGPQLIRVDLCMGYHVLVIVVGFHPGGLHRLLRIPMCEMVDQPFDASLLLGTEIQNLSAKLCNITNYDQMVTLIQLYFLKMSKRLKEVLPIDKVLLRLINGKNTLSIEQLAQQACVSKRTLERQFQQRIGMAPKVFSRLLRFTKARTFRIEHPDMTWLHIANLCGYADQMHLIRDFKEFASTTPGLLECAYEMSNLKQLAKAIL